jgi:hypothetical protein
VSPYLILRNIIIADPGIADLFLGPCARVHPGNARLIYHSNVNVRRQSDLARKTSVGCKVSLGREYVPLSFFHFTDLACDPFHTARCAAGVSAAAMKDIDTVVLKAKDKFSSSLAIEFDRAVGRFCLY